MSFDTNYSNTPTVPVTPARTADAPQPINFGEDFRVLREAPGEVVLTNIHAPIQNPETIRIAFSEIADVFKGTSIEANTDAVNMNSGMKRGCSILTQMTGVGVDANGVRFPYSAHLVLKIPYGPEPTWTSVAQVISRLMGSMYDTGEATIETRMDGLLRGVLTPPDL